MPIEQERRDALHRRHAHLAQFSPAVIVALDLTASRGYERLLQAVEHANANRHLRLLPDAPLEVLSASWRAWTLDDQGRPVRTRYELALWMLVRDALRARGLYRARSHRYGDPAGWMMPRVQWQRERVELAAVGRPLDGATRLAELEVAQRQLVRRLQDGFDARERVLFDGHRIVGEPAGEQRVEKPALTGVVHGMLPLVEISSLVIETRPAPRRLGRAQRRPPRPACRGTARRRHRDRVRADTLTALGLCAEVGDFDRFESAEAFMSFVGLVPSERSSGEKRRQGSITKAGNAHARRLLVEAAWHSLTEPDMHGGLASSGSVGPPHSFASGLTARSRSALESAPAGNPPLRCADFP